jgi:hypothetical protein
LLGQCPIWAQQPTAASRTTQVVLDTTPLLFVMPLAPERVHFSEDTLPDAQFRMYDPARQSPIDRATLGNLGTPQRALLFDPAPRRGFDPGVHAFDLYNLQPADLRFYQHSRTFSEVFFSQGRTQFDGMLNARLARTFSGGTTFSMDYRTINNLGQFRYQRAKHNALLLGLWVPVGRRYDLFLIFSKNVNRQQDNGGIVSDDVFGSGDFSGPISAPINLPELRAFSRLADRSLHLTQHLGFVGNSEAGKRVLRATHSLNWARQDYKFSDGSTQEGLGDNAAFWGDFLVDQRGLRHFITMDRVDNSLTLNTFKAKNKGRPSDLLALGLAHSYFNLRQEPEARRAFSNLFATGKITLTPSTRFSFQGDAALGLLTNLGEYQLQGQLSLELGRAGQLRASLLSQRYPVPLIAQRLYVSQRPLWENNFVKPVENVLSGTYALPSLGFEATLRTILLNNFIYYDQEGKSRQTGNAVQLAQLILRENLRLGPFRLDNTFALQQNNSGDVLRLPSWFSKNSLYFSGKIFKKRMLLNLGADFRIHSAFRPDAYQPLVWQFNLQDTVTQQPFPWVDAFAAFKVQSFRFFFRYENLGSLWNKTRVYYQTAQHPLPFGAIRFGIAWRFMDNNLPDANAPNDANTPPPGSGAPTIQRRRQ